MATENATELLKALVEAGLMASRKGESETSRTLKARAIDAVQALYEADQGTQYNVILTYSTLAQSPQEAFTMALDAVAQGGIYAEVYENEGDHPVLDGEASELIEKAAGV